MANFPELSSEVQENLHRSDVVLSARKSIVSEDSNSSMGTKKGRPIEDEGEERNERSSNLSSSADHMMEDNEGDWNQKYSTVSDAV